VGILSCTTADECPNLPPDGGHGAGKARAFGRSGPGTRRGSAAGKAMRTNGDTLIHRQTVNDPTGAAMASKTIEQWAKSHGFSRGFFYILREQGRAPRTMKINACRRISDESDAEWVRAREAETAETELHGGALAVPMQTRDLIGRDGAATNVPRDENTFSNPAAKKLRSRPACARRST